MSAFEAHGLFHIGLADSSDDDTAGGDSNLGLFDRGNEQRRQRMVYDLATHKTEYQAKVLNPVHFLESMGTKSFAVWFDEKQGPNEIRQCIDYLYYQQKYVEALQLCEQLIDHTLTLSGKKVQTTEQYLTAADCAARIGALSKARHYADTVKMTLDPGLHYNRASVYVACRHFSGALQDYRYFLSQRRHDHNGWRLVGATFALAAIDGLASTTHPSSRAESAPLAIDALIDAQPLPTTGMVTATAMSDLSLVRRATNALLLLLAHESLIKAQWLLRHAQWPDSHKLAFAHAKLTRELHGIETMLAQTATIARDLYSTLPENRSLPEKFTMGRQCFGMLCRCCQQLSSELLSEHESLAVQWAVLLTTLRRQPQLPANQSLLLGDLAQASDFWVQELFLTTAPTGVDGNASDCRSARHL
ncbi:hypothetical protein H4R35_000045 [Dimargaris xerosporica]|nr:hypothetical protein H4R35_000045 [Dimargaris xerosporica]